MPPDAASPSSPTLRFASIARLPSPKDNAAIAVRRIDPATRIELPDGSHAKTRHTILPGHRFAVRKIAAGEPLTSWGMPFGEAIRPIAPGEYLCNALTLESLGRRDLDTVQLPETPCFRDPPAGAPAPPCRWQPSAQVPPVRNAGHFLGYDRGPRRGAGTRNYIVLLGTSARTAGLVESLAQRLAAEIGTVPGLDGIVPVAHTEGATAHRPNNETEVLRTLAGFICHPNVAAVVAIDEGTEAINNHALAAFMARHGYPLADVPHRFLSAGRAPGQMLRLVRRYVVDSLPQATATPRSRLPLAGLRLALQCGGSDAFSGVSGNPLAARLARELIRHGGTAIQAETDEIVGAEAYMLERVRDQATAERLLAVIERFRERLAWHGATVEANPSEGNRLRGLYNIVLKSLGAAAKKAPDVRLDAVIDYAEPVSTPGFVFMDSPGNDLESVAGQVAAGANMIVFVTGNGSVTNFPFVPTLKIVTTTERYQLLSREMDINAGAFLDGTPMDALVSRSFEKLVRTAFGAQTLGERAGHAQVSIWRNWHYSGPPATGSDACSVPPPAGIPIDIAPRAAPLPVPPRLPGWRRPDGTATLERLGLIMPVSLCAGQVARLAARHLESRELGSRTGIERFVALPHTEGCGFAGERLHRQLLALYQLHATHPAVATALFLEHGCEKTPNDIVRSHLAASGLDPDSFGWASIQLDGGIEAVLAKIERWFATHLPPGTGEWQRTVIPLTDLHLGIISPDTIAPSTEPNPGRGPALGEIVHAFLARERAVFIPHGDPLWTDAGFLDALSSRPLRNSSRTPTLALAQAPARPGLHIVDTEATTLAENIAALVAAGAQAIVVPAEGGLIPGHPLVPVIGLPGAPRGAQALLDSLADRLQSSRTDPSVEAPAPVFQIPRGRDGIST